MLMGDEDGVQLFQLFADGGQPLGELPHAQPVVHEEARFFGGQRGGIPGTAAGQHAELDDTRLLLTLQNTTKRAETEWLENVLDGGGVWRNPPSVVRHTRAAAAKSQYLNGYRAESKVQLEAA